MKTNVEVEHKNGSIDWNNPPLYWTDTNNTVYLLAVTHIGTSDDVWYQAISLKNGQRWVRDYMDPKRAVAGLDPFYGKITITQKD